MNINKGYKKQVQANNGFYKLKDVHEMTVSNLEYELCTLANSTRENTIDLTACDSCVSKCAYGKELINRKGVIAYSKVKIIKDANKATTHVKGILPIYAKNIIYLIDKYNMSSHEISSLCNTSPERIRLMKRGKCNPGVKFVYTVCKNFGVKSNWFIFGKNTDNEFDRLNKILPEKRITGSAFGNSVSFDRMINEIDTPTGRFMLILALHCMNLNDFSEICNVDLGHVRYAVFKKSIDSLIPIVSEKLNIPAEYIERGVDL